MALYSILIFYAYNLVKSKKLRYLIYLVLTSLVLLIGFTRVYLGVHYAGDILGGWLMGLVVSIITYAVLKKPTITEYGKKEK